MEDRVRKLNDLPPNPKGKYVLYHMRVNRRAESNHALAYAMELANELDLPVFCREDPDDRFPAFVLAGVAETQKRLARLGIGYGFGEGGTDAAAAVTDDWPLPLPD